MNYIVIDFEFNQSFRNKALYNRDCPFEIIQIGAIKIDENYNTISSFNSLVKPSVYTSLHPYVQRLTKINIDELASAKPFYEVYKDFSNFINSPNNIFCVWGMADMKELFRNIQFHKLDNTIIPIKYINIQNYASKYFKLPRKEKIGLQNAISLLDIPYTQNFHDAYNDAYYTKEIFKILHNESIEPETYDYSNENKPKTKKPKLKINFKGLISQFEKMYDRKMTEEEISIIKLSYKMGLTNQFQKKI